jgi:hypothetical protein
VCVRCIEGVAFLASHSWKGGKHESSRVEKESRPGEDAHGFHFPDKSYVLSHRIEALAYRALVDIPRWHHGRRSRISARYSWTADSVTFDPGYRPHFHQKF